MKSPIADYHMHTYLCGHASGTPVEYARAAVAKGLREIGFSDHAPLLSHRDPSITMDIAQLPEYLQMIKQLREEMSGEIVVKLGIEADFLPGYEAQTAAVLKDAQYDYVIGSVHFIEDWAFDDPKDKTGWQQKDTNKIYRQYYSYLRNSADSGLFDIMAHVDLVKKFGHRPSSDMQAEVQATAEAFKADEVAIEINSSGLRKPVKEIYPDLASLKIYCAAGVPITFGSDAHAPDEVGMDFEKSAELARQAGYKEYVLFKNRRIEKTVGL